MNKYFEDLDKDCRAFFNLKSFQFMQDFMRYFKITQIYFNGGAILNQDKLKKQFEIDDLDVHMIQDEEDADRIFESVKTNPMSTALIQRGSTASTYKSIVFKYLGKKIDFQMKKTGYKPEDHCTFDIDSLCTSISNDNPNFLIQNSHSLTSLKTQTTQLQAKQSDIYRILRRLVILVAKYDIKKFKIDKDSTIDMDKDNTEVIQKLSEQKIRDEISILEKSDKTKASILTKFLCMCYRVKDPFEYVIKINNSNIFDYIFPNFSCAIKNNDFLENLRTESLLPEEKRFINNTNDFIALLMKFNKDNVNLAKELLILKKDIFNEVNMHTIDLISKTDNTTTKTICDYDKK